MGYVGPVLARRLREQHPDAEVVGFDSGFFAHCITGARTLPEAFLDAQHFGDIRELPEELVRGANAVVHLAAVSNDPMGNKFEAGTHDINFPASARLAALAARQRVQNFVFASSCSVYGIASNAARTEQDAVN